MDNNFSKILDIFKRLDESYPTRDDVVIDGKQVDLSSVEIDSNDHFRDPLNAYVSSAKFVDGTPLSDDQCKAVEDNFPGVVTDNLQDLQIDTADHYRDSIAHGDFNEGSVEECGSNMSPLEARLRARWEATKEGLAEYGMTTGGTTGATGPTDSANPQAPNPAAAQKLKAGVQSLKSAGLDIDTTKLDQALTTAGAGGDINGQEKDAVAALAPQIAGIAGDPQLTQQFKQLLDKSKQQQANANTKNQPPAQGAA